MHDRIAGEWQVDINLMHQCKIFEGWPHRFPRDPVEVTDAWEFWVCMWQALASAGDVGLICPPTAAHLARHHRQQISAPASPF